MRRLGPIAACLLLVAAFLVPEARSQGGGFTASLVLRHAPHPVPRGASTLVAHASPGFDPQRPIEIVLFLHGWNGCVESLVRGGAVACTPGRAPSPGWDVASRVDAARRNTLVLAPQLAFLRRDGSAGRLAQEGFVRAMVDEAMTALGDRLSGRGVEDVAHVTVVAHSAGFESALVVGRRSGLGAVLDRIALMDALYDVEGAFLRWALDDERRSLVSVHASGRTGLHGARLGELAARTLGEAAVARDPEDLAAAVRNHRVVVKSVHTSHVETLLRYLPDVLARP